MGFVGQARTIVTNAEAELRRLMEAALRAKKYEAVSEIAALAARLAGAAEATSATNLKSGAGASAGANSARTGERADAGRATVGVTRGGPLGWAINVAAPDYPRFEREGDRLVKIGWSKKDGAPYEHKAPRAAVMATVETIAKRIKPAKKFAQDEIGEVPMPDGTLVPAYQVYATFKWLQYLGAIKKMGKNEYWLPRTVMPGDLELCWLELTPRWLDPAPSVE